MSRTILPEDDSKEELRKFLSRSSKLKKINYFGDWINYDNAAGKLTLNFQHGVVYGNISPLNDLINVPHYYDGYDIPDTTDFEERLTAMGFNTVINRIPNNKKNHRFNMLPTLKFDTNAKKLD